jgi:hypothetical protein
MSNFFQRISLSAITFGSRIVWLWILLIGVPFIIIAMLAIIYGSNDFSTKVPVKLDDTFIRKIPRIDEPKTHMLIANSGTITVRIQRTWQNMALLFSCILALFGGVLVTTYQIKSIIRSFRRNEPFDKINLRRIRIIAFVLIAYFVGKQVYILVAKQIVSSMFVFDHMKLGYDRDFGFLIAGLALLVLEAVFKRGTYLEEEEQLTI